MLSPASWGHNPKSWYGWKQPEQHVKNYIFKAFLIFLLGYWISCQSCVLSVVHSASHSTASRLIMLSAANCMAHYKSVALCTHFVWFVLVLLRKWNLSLCRSCLRPSTSNTQTLTPYQFGILAIDILRSPKHTYLVWHFGHLYCAFDFLEVHLAFQLSAFLAALSEKR